VCKRNADPEVLAYAEKALAVGGNANRLRQKMHEDYNTTVTVKFIHNLRQKVGHAGTFYSE
jgi:hypothetical protein